MSQGPTNPYESPPEIVPGQPGDPIRRGSIKTYLGESIFCLICCGGLFAIPAIVYAAQVNSKLLAGDYEGAVRASENAKKWCIIAVCIMVALGALSIVQVMAIF